MTTKAGSNGNGNGSKQNVRVTSSRSAGPQPMRWQRLGQGHICAECLACRTGGESCAPARQELRTYSGLRFTSDGFDCALPVSIDSHSHCSYGCLYCFSDNLVQHRAGANRPVGQTSLAMLERIFAGQGGAQGEQVRAALRYDRVASGEYEYPCPIQLGAINDPCDAIERQQGWLLEFISIAQQYKQPVRISTKGTVLREPEYLQALAKAPHLFWVTFSIISPDDELMGQIDRRAPLPSERIATMKALSDIGVRTSLRFRPMMPGLSDSTKNHKYAYRDLIDMAADAGAIACSYEVAFAPGIAGTEVKARWQRINEIVGFDLYGMYMQFGRQACTRPPYSWTEPIMHAVHNYAHKRGLVLGVSDPAWKQLGDSGCCCGILPEDPVFGNWERESATNQLLIGTLQPDREFGHEDITPAWAYDKRSCDMVNYGPGPGSKYKRDHDMWSDKLHENWNDVARERGPLVYFQGAMRPSSKNAAGDIRYKVHPLQRHYKHDVPFWKVHPDDIRDDDHAWQHYVNPYAAEAYTVSSCSGDPCAYGRYCGVGEPLQVLSE